MLAWWNSLDLLQQVLYVVAVPSTLILLIQTVLMFIGIGGEGDADIAAGDAGEIGGDLDADPDGDFVPEATDVDDTGDTGGFRLLSLKGIIAFLTVTSWSALAMLDMQVSTPVALPVAFLLGCAALFLIALLFRYATHLQQSGNLDLHNAIGRTAEVYLPIAENGKGKVTLVLQERFVEQDAICPTGAVAKGKRVKVIGLAEGNTLMVTPLE